MDERRGKPDDGVVQQENENWIEASLEQRRRAKEFVLYCLKHVDYMEGFRDCLEIVESGNIAVGILESIDPIVGIQIKDNKIVGLKVMFTYQSEERENTKDFYLKGRAIQESGVENLGEMPEYLAKETESHLKLDE